MAHITNRSPYAVTVRKQPDLNRQFPFSKAGKARAEAYEAEVKAQGYKPSLRQLETAFQLLIRRKDRPTFRATFDSLEEAEKTRLKIEGDGSLKIFRDYAAATKHTFAELCERYIKEVSPEHKGSASEICRLRRILREEAFPHKLLARLTTEDLQSFIKRRTGEVAPATVDRDIDIIAQVLRYADDVWKIAPCESPLKGLRRPRYFNERNRRLRAGEEEMLLDAARDDENPYIEPLIVIALQTAMRRGEILGLTRQDVDFEARSALLRETKNGRSRNVPLNEIAMKALRALPETEDGRFFPVTPNALKLAWTRRVLPRAGIEGLHFHDLRHEATSRLAESGHYPLVELQAITGHRDVRMLLRYSHLCVRKLAEKMDRTQQGLVREYAWRGRRRRVVDKFGDDVAQPAAASAARSARRGGNVVELKSGSGTRAASAKK